MMPFVRSEETSWSAPDGCDGAFLVRQSVLRYDPHRNRPEEQPSWGTGTNTEKRFPQNLGSGWSPGNLVHLSSAWAPGRGSLPHTGKSFGCSPGAKWAPAGFGKRAFAGESLRPWSARQKATIGSRAWGKGVCSFPLAGFGVHGAWRCHPELWCFRGGGSVSAECLGVSGLLSAPPMCGSFWRKGLGQAPSLQSPGGGSRAP